MRLAERPLTYAPPRVTTPDRVSWAPPAGRSFERTVRIGHGAEQWATARTAVLAWAVKTRSGFRVDGGVAVAGRDYWLRAVLGPVVVREPVRVVAVVDEPARCGFAYGTLTGHPVAGEEAFVVHRSADGTVWLTLRSVTAPGGGAWRFAFPLVLVAQRIYRRRYLRALSAE